MKIKNVSAKNVSTDDIKNLDGTNVVINAGQEVTLFDEDIEKSPDIKAYMTDGTLVKIDDSEPETGTPVEDITDPIREWIIGCDTQIIFPDTTPSGVKEGMDVEIQVCAADELNKNVDIFNNVQKVTVTLANVSATAPTIDGGAGPVEVTFFEGKATVTIAATGAGDVTLSLSLPTPNTGLTVTSTATVTLT